MFDREGLRDAIKKYSPPWLADGVAEKFMYTIGLTLDGFVEGLNQAVRARMPGIGDPSALKYIGSDRNIDRGIGESDAAYGARLQRAFPSWRSAGSPWAVLRQLRAYLQVAIKLKTVSNTGVWHELAATAGVDADDDFEVTRYRHVPNNWDWDGLATRWWRAWVILYAESGVPWSSEGTWGDGQLWGDGGTWGSTATPEEVQNVRRLVGKWKPAHCVVPWILVAINSSWIFDPVAGTVPAGTWGPWSTTIAGVRVPSRSPNAVYWDGVDRGF